MSNYGYGSAESGNQSSSDAASKSYPTGTSDTAFPMANYSQMSSAYGPMGRGASRGSTDVKTDRTYRPY